jgi:hypothetical protein
VMLEMWTDRLSCRTFPASTFYIHNVEWEAGKRQVGKQFCELSMMRPEYRIMTARMTTKQYMARAARKIFFAASVKPTW